MRLKSQLTQTIKNLITDGIAGFTIYICRYTFIQTGTNIQLNLVGQQRLIALFQQLRRRADRAIQLRRQAGKHILQTSHQCCGNFVDGGIQGIDIHSHGSLAERFRGLFQLFSHSGILGSADAGQAENVGQAFKALDAIDILQPTLANIYFTTVGIGGVVDNNLITGAFTTKQI